MAIIATSRFISFTKEFSVLESVTKVVCTQHESRQAMFNMNTNCMGDIMGLAPIMQYSSLVIDVCP